MASNRPPVHPSADELIESLFFEDEILEERFENLFDGEEPCEDTLVTNEDVSGIPTDTGEDENPLQRQKRKKSSSIWNDFKIVTLPDGKTKGKCNHCSVLLAYPLETKPTTQFWRHLERCKKRPGVGISPGQQYFAPSASNNQGRRMTVLTDGKFDMLKMRERVANWVLMHEHPFTIVEEDGFNDMMYSAIPEYHRISRHMVKGDCMKIYEFHKRKLELFLKTVKHLSLTTDMWCSGHQKQEYMVITGHYVDSRWGLNKRVLNFVHIPPPRRGFHIAEGIWKCLKEWGIEHKVISITLDNASANDVAISYLRSYSSRLQPLACSGKLFHVRCAAHILNLMVQDGLHEIRYQIEDVRESIAYVKHSEARIRLFADLVKQLNLPNRKLILDCKTRWNSTYEMLQLASQYKEVFPLYHQSDNGLDRYPTPEDWEKVAKVCDVLELFSEATNTLSGSEYPTSNLFLNEIWSIKVMLDEEIEEGDDIIKPMVRKMKVKFDKYWGDTNLLMALGAILDPRCKMEVINYTFPKIYSDPIDADTNIHEVKTYLYQIFDEYVKEADTSSTDTGVTARSGSNPSAVVQSPVQTTGGKKEKAWKKWHKIAMTSVPSNSSKSDLDHYLEQELHLVDPDSDVQFEALEWWKINSSKYPILSRMARDILAIPVSSVASESTFSASGRVIDAYRSSLSTETVQMLLCGADWCRIARGIKKNTAYDDYQPVEITLPV